jgi:nucleotide-binding universal stress UspA family protein
VKRADALGSQNRWTQSVNRPESEHPVLVCFDGSPDAEHAIAYAAGLLGPCPAVVLTVWEPLPAWEPYDPGALISAGIATAGARTFGLEEIAIDVARETLDHGVALAQAAGFDARGRLAHGKTWRAICETADELGADPIVVGARGHSRIESVLLGSVSLAVATHAARPVLVVRPDREHDDGGNDR